MHFIQFKYQHIKSSLLSLCFKKNFVLEDGEFQETGSTSTSSSTETIYRKIEIPNEADLREKLQNLDVHQKEVINIGIKYCKDLVKARKIGNKKPEAPLLMVHGGAGAGKSTVINILAMMTQKILLQPGDNPDHP